MDAGDTLHFTQTTAFSDRAAAGRGAARPRRRRGAERRGRRRHPLAAQGAPVPGRLHRPGRRRARPRDRLPRSGQGRRLAQAGDRHPLRLPGGSAATSAARRRRRWRRPSAAAATRRCSPRPRSGTTAGKAAARAARPIKRAGYPNYGGNFYTGERWQDSLAAGAVQLYRASCTVGPCDDAYLADFVEYITSDHARPDGNLGVIDSFASFAAADACGALGEGTVPGEAGTRRLRGAARQRSDRRPPRPQERLRDAGLLHLGHDGDQRRQRRARRARHRRSRRARATAARSPRAPATTCSGVTRSARSFVVGYGRRAARHPHHWGSVFGVGVPSGAVVGGPAPIEHIKSQGFSAKGPFNSRFAAYADKLAQLRHRRAGARLRGRLGAAARRAGGSLLKAR